MVYFLPGGGTLGICGWGCAARTLEPLAYTRAKLQMSHTTIGRPVVIFLTPINRLHKSGSIASMVALNLRMMM